MAVPRPGWRGQVLGGAHEWTDGRGLASGVCAGQRCETLKYRLGCASLSVCSLLMSLTVVLLVPCEALVILVLRAAGLSVP